MDAVRELATAVGIESACLPRVGAARFFLSQEACGDLPCE